MTKEEIAALFITKIINEDVTRNGLKDTPARLVKAWREWTRGYDLKVEDVLRTFDDGAQGYNEALLVRDIPIYSHCEHHLAPFFGTVTVGYIPEKDKGIVGLSKLSRVCDIFAHRLQVQERLTVQIADALETHLSSKAVGVIVQCRHLCMESRGIHKQGHTTLSSAMRGAFLDDPSARAEFLHLWSQGR